MGTADTDGVVRRGNRVPRGRGGHVSAPDAPGRRRVPSEGEGHRARGGEARVLVSARRVPSDAGESDGEVDAGAELAEARVRGPDQHRG